MKLHYIIIIFIGCISPTAVRAQAGINTDSLLQLVKEAYIYGYPLEQSYRMYTTLPDNGLLKNINMQMMTIGYPFIIIMP